MTLTMSDKTEIKETINEAVASAMRVPSREVLAIDARLAKIEEFVDGNGKEGAKLTIRLLKVKVDDVDRKMDILTADLKAAVEKFTNVSGGKYDEDNHPQRRKEDTDKTPERTWFIEKVLPGLVSAFILFVAGIALALVVLNVKELFP